MPKYVKAPEKEVKENKEDTKDLEKKAEPKTPEDLAMKEEVNTLRQDLDDVKIKLGEREEEKLRREDIMDEETKKFLGRVEDSMGSIEKRLSTQEAKDRQAEVLQQEARREEKTNKMIEANISGAVAPIAKSVADLGENLKIVRGMICDDKGECIVPTKNDIEALRGKIANDVLESIKSKEEAKPKEEKPEKKTEAEKSEEEGEKSIKKEEKLPKGVLGTDLTLEEFLKDEKSQEVFVNKYLGDAGIRKALERCTSPECKVIREEMEKRGIKVLKKRVGGGMLGADWEEID